MDSGLRESFRLKLKEIADKKPAYVRGGASDPSKGLDCSGYLFLAAKWAGIMGPRRTTSYLMSMGLDGWSSDMIPLFSMAQSTDLTFWTWKKTPHKINSHTGAFLKNEPKHLQGLEGLSIAHAGSRGVVIVPFRGAFLDDLSVIRRLNIGD